MNLKILCMVYRCVRDMVLMWISLSNQVFKRNICTRDSKLFYLYFSRLEQNVLYAVCMTVLILVLMEIYLKLSEIEVSKLVMNYKYLSAFIIFKFLQSVF